MPDQKNKRPLELLRAANSCVSYRPLWGCSLWSEKGNALYMFMWNCSWGVDPSAGTECVPPSAKRGWRLGLSGSGSGASGQGQVVIIWAVDFHHLLPAFARAGRRIPLWRSGCSWASAAWAPVKGGSMFTAALRSKCTCVSALQSQIKSALPDVVQIPPYHLSRCHE